MSYFVIEVKTKRRKEGVLFLVEKYIDKPCSYVLDQVKEKLPILNRDKAFVKKEFDLGKIEDFSTMESLYMDKVIYFKIRTSDIGTFYVTETYIPVNELDFHELPVSVIHINTKHDIMENSNFKKDYDVINEKIRSVLGCSCANFSLIEVNMIWTIKKEMVEMWKTILRKNDISFVFHVIDLDTIIRIAKILYEMACEYDRHLYFFFVDKDNMLYRIQMNSTMEIIPLESDRYII